MKSRLALTLSIALLALGAGATVSLATFGHHTPPKTISISKEFPSTTCDQIRNKLGPYEDWVKQNLGVTLSAYGKNYCLVTLTWPKH